VVDERFVLLFKAQRPMKSSIPGIKTGGESTAEAGAALAILGDQMLAGIGVRAAGLRGWGSSQE